MSDTFTTDTAEAASPERARRPAPAARSPRAKSAGTTFRDVLFWVHLAVGISTGIVVLIMSVTGVALAYQKQLLDREAAAYRAAPSSAASPRLPLDTLLARVSAASPERKPVSMTVSSDPLAAVTVGFENRRTGFVDPYTGAVVVEQSRLRSFFTLMERWHRSLATGESLRDKLGVTLTGAANLGFFFLVLSGAYLWLPRRWSRQRLKPIALLDTGARGKARDWNWHHVFGIWALPVLFVVVLSGVFISYQWPMALVGRVAGFRAQGEGGGGGGAPRGAGGAGERRGGGGEEAPPVVKLDAFWPQAASRVEGWKTIQVRLPRDSQAPLAFTISTGTRPNQRSTLELDAATGAVKQFRRYADQDAGRKVRSWVRPLHTGEAGGLLGQTLAMLASAAGAVLVWTGISLSLRRFRAWLGRRRRDAALPAG